MNFADDWTDTDLYDRGLRNQQYNDAYGDYSGGYGQIPPSDSCGPLMEPPGPPPMGPPRMFPRQPRLGPPPPPPTILGRGFGPGGPHVHRARGDPPAMKYLIRCGVPKNTLNQLPRDLFDLIEPNYCGLCGHNFDTFALSRIHYVSKQHQKSVKKWLNQNNSGYNPQETPMRARELYCELCDVQITSKVHANSHYEGKSHKSVVEGRKNPKNPMLLQPGMERRFAQLIRREKKFLKQSETTTPKEEDETKTKDVKPVQPDLYCDICKTSVTCTEQMTAHLNGKRHLTKEKNYILKSMRGEIDSTATGGDAEVTEAEPEAEAEAEAGAEAKAEGPKEGAEVKQETDWSEDWE